MRAALVNQIGLGRFANSFLDYARLRAGLKRSADEEDLAIGDKGTSRWPLAKHVIALGMALESLLKEELQEMRATDPGAFGVALATDESPPSQRRFCGFRFQVTVVYVSAWLPQENGIAPRRRPWLYDRGSWTFVIAPVMIALAS